MRCKRILLVLIGMSLVAISAQPARAYTLLQVIPIFQLNQLYDDNIELTASHPQGDFITNVVFGAYLTYHGPERSGTFQYETVGEKFLKYPEHDNIGDTHFFQFSDQERLGKRTTLSVDDWFLTGKIPSSLFTSGSVADPMPTLNAQLALAIIGRIRSISNFADANFNHNFDERWKLQLGAKHELLSTTNVTTLLANFSGRGEYALTPRTLVDLGYEYYDFTFSNAPSPIQAHYPQVGVRWDATEQFQFNGQIGPIGLQEPDNAGTLFKLGYSATATYRDSAWKIIVSGGQEPGITAFGGAGVTRNASSNIGYVIRRNLTLFAGMSYYDLQSGQSGSDVLTYGGGFSYRLKPGVTFYSQYLGVVESAGPGNPSQMVAANTNGTVKSNAYMFGMSLSFEAFRKAL